jgi:hypothetical protein
MLFEYICFVAESCGEPAVETVIMKAPVPTVRMWPAASTRATAVSLLAQTTTGAAIADPSAARPLTLATRESPAATVSLAI